jgi:hypothetical protein
MCLYIYNFFLQGNQFNFKGWNHEKISFLKTSKRKKNSNKKIRIKIDRKKTS